MPALLKIANPIRFQKLTRVMQIRGVDTYVRCGPRNSKALPRRTRRNHKGSRRNRRADCATLFRGSWLFFVSVVAYAADLLCVSVVNPYPNLQQPLIRRT